MRWRRYKRGGDWGGRFPGAFLLYQRPATDMRRCSGISGIQGLVFAFVAAASYAAGPTLVIGDPGSAPPPLSLSHLMRLLEGPLAKRRHEMAPRQKRGDPGAPLRDHFSFTINPSATGGGSRQSPTLVIGDPGSAPPPLSLSHLMRLLEGPLAKRRHEMAPRQKRGDPGAPLRDHFSFTINPSATGGGSRQSPTLVIGDPGSAPPPLSLSHLMRLLEGPLFKRRHEMAPLQKRGAQGQPLRLCRCRILCGSWSGCCPRSAMRWRCYRRGGSWAATFREHSSFTNDPSAQGGGPRHCLEMAGEIG